MSLYTEEEWRLFLKFWPYDQRNHFIRTSVEFDLLNNRDPEEGLRKELNKYLKDRKNNQEWLVFQNMIFENIKLVPLQINNQDPIIKKTLYGD